MARSTFRAVFHGNFKQEYMNQEYVRLSVAILIGSIPAGIVGLLWHTQIEAAFSDPKFVAMNLVITGLILFLTRLAHPREGKKIGAVSALLIGLAQAVAVLPGISRSGSTMSMGLYLKHAPVQAARFSFLLSIPVIAGASLLEIIKYVRYGSSVELVPLIVGTLVASIAGYLSIKVLLQIIVRRKLNLLAFYCLAVGVIGIIFI
jgi:undecaprenyl-diphosphatase